MAWYYVKSGGTAGGTTNGRFASEQSGAFSGLSDYYDNMSEAISNSGTLPTNGDFIMVSDVHSHDYGGSAGTLDGSWSGTIVAMSVSDTDVTAYSIGAIETSNSTLTFGSNSGTMIFWGMKFESANANGLHIQIGTARIIFNECNLESDRNGSGRILYVANDGQYVTCNDCTFKAAHDGCMLVGLYGGSFLEINGGSYDGSAANITDFTDGFFHSGGGKIRVDGMDLSEMANSATAYLVGGIGNDGSTDDTIDVKFINCEIPANLTYIEETLSDGSQRLLEFIGTDATDHGRHEIWTGIGSAILDAANFITGQQKLQSGASPVQATYLVQTQARCTRYHPFILRIPVSNVDLTQTASNELKLYVGLDGTTATFNNHSLMLVVRFADATTPTIAKFASSAGAKTGVWLPHPTATPGALTTSSGVWDTAPDSQWELTVDLSAVSPDALPSVIHEAWLYVMAPTSGDTLLVDSEIRAA